MRGVTAAPVQCPVDAGPPPTITIARPHAHVAPVWWLAPAVLILVPVVGSFIAWASLIGWCSSGMCPAGGWMELRGFLKPAPLTIQGVTLLTVWYGAVVVLTTIGWRLGLGTATTPERVETTSGPRFERRYFFFVLTVATIGIGYAFVTISSSTSILEALSTQSGNAFTEALPDSAGLATLRYATILAAPVGVHLWRRRLLSPGFMVVAILLLVVNAMIASRLSLLMAIVVYVVLSAASHRGTPGSSRGRVRPWRVLMAVGVLFLLLTALNYVRNGNYYRDAGVSNPVAMNLYQSGAYLAVPAQVSMGVSDAVMRGTFDKHGGVVDSAWSAVPTFFVPAGHLRAKESLSGDSYDQAVSFAPNFTTNSEFADTYADFGAWGWLYTLTLFPLAGYLLGRLLTYGAVIAGSAGVIAYSLAEVWRIQLLTQGISVFLVLLTVVGGIFAARGPSTAMLPDPVSGKEM